MAFVAPRVPRRARAGRSASVRRSARCADFPAMLAAVARRTTRCVRCALSAQTSATSQTTKRAARAATATVLLGASRGAPRPAHARLGRRGVGALPVEYPDASLLRQVLSGGGDFWGGCDRQPGAGRASARIVSDSRPLFERRERSERSEFGRAGPRLVGTAKSAQGADRPSMSPHRTVPAAAREVLCSPSWRLPKRARAAGAIAWPHDCSLRERAARRAVPRCL